MESKLHHTWVTDEERARDRFVKEHWATMTYKEIAGELGISVGPIVNVVKRLKRSGELPDKHKHSPVACPKSCITDNSICGDYGTVSCPDKRRAKARISAYRRQT